MGDRAGRRCEYAVGGKAVGLYRLIGERIPVPRFCVLSTAVFEAALRPHRSAIEAVLSAVDWDRRESIEAASARIQDRIMSTCIRRPAARRIRRVLDREFPRDATFAVRSSVVGEDAQENSFAGQMESFLNIPPDRVCDAVRKVWASAFSARALFYRAGRGLPVHGISTGVIIQCMVRSDCAGVAFSRDPQSADECSVVTAGYGLGEGVVHDLVETDTYRVRRDGRITSRHVSRRKSRADAYPGGAPRIVRVAAQMQSQPVLSDDRIREVAAVARELEQALGSPQDVEWAYTDGSLFVLQTRPIISAGRGHAADWRVWDSSNIVESYPGLTLPLTFSFVRECYAASFGRAVDGFLIRRREIRADRHIFRQMIGLLDGRIYYNLLNWYRMMAYLPGYRQYRKSWDDMIGVGRVVPFPRRRLSWINRMFAVCAVVVRLLSVRRTARLFQNQFQETYARYRRLDFNRLQAPELMATYRAMERDFTRRWHLTLYNDFCAIRYYDWLRTLCRRWGLDPQGNLANDLLCGEAGVESVRPIHSLLSICELISREPRFGKLFADAGDAKVWSELQSRPDLSPLKLAFERHLEVYGDRGTEELKLEMPTYRDRPEALIGLIRSYIERGTSASDMRAREMRRRNEAERTVRAVLRHPFKRVLFRFVLRQARCAVANRENMRFARSRLFGLVRRLFRRLADLFVEQNLLDRREDFYYLTVQEVFDYVQGSAAVQNLRRLVHLRRTEYVAFARRPVQERIETTGVPYPLPATGAEKSGTDQRTLQGTGCSSGIVQGDAWIVTDPHADDRPGDYVLVTESTDPGWVFLMIRARGVVVERGSLLSHTAIIGRELGIPTVVGVRGATRRIADGQRIWLDGSTGEVRCA
jgi:phosphohistidine swiveling domain-containing protein